MPKRIQLTLLGVLIVLVGTLSLYVIGGGTSDRADSVSPSYPATPQANSNPLVSSSPSVAAQPLALWFGDSIVEGCCRTSGSAPNMATVASELAGWSSNVQGFGGTGYLTTATVNGTTRPTYPEEIRKLLPGSSYDVVVVVGGNNDGDISKHLTAFRAAVRSTLGQIRAALPAARIVVVGPYSPSGVGYADQRRIESEEAARLAAPFIDGIAERWMVGHPEMISRDGFHPNDAGQRYLGERLGADLVKLNLTRAP